jgi:Holliday junction resolvasome RuvABC ATP-dependent DNA helicase subunit
MDEIEKIIDEISFRKSKSKDYEKMQVEEISKELQNIMRFEQESLKKIEEFEKMQKNQDVADYLKMISMNTTQREITEIQEIYLKKIDSEYLNLK